MDRSPVDLGTARATLAASAEALAEAGSRLRSHDEPRFGATGPGRLGDLGREFSRQWQRALDAQYLPHVISLAIPAGTADLPDTLAKPAGGGVKSWVCQGVTCLPPITDPTAMLAVVSARE